MHILPDNSIFETHLVFDKMSVTLKDQVDRREEAFKAYDDVVDWQRYMKDRPKNITILSSYQLKKVRTILRPWEDLNETIGEAIKKAQSIYGRRWYAADNLMDTLCFLVMGLIKNACPPKLMIEQVEQRRDEATEKISGLIHISIDDVDRLIKQPLSIEGKIHIYIRIWHKLAKNEI